MVKALRRYLLLSSFLLATAAGAYSQQASTPAVREDGPPESPSYIFASPNRRVNMSLGEALRNLNSGDEIAIILAARDIACRAGLRTTVWKAVGNWSDGGENSVLIKAAGDEAAVRYADAWLGRRFGQKGVIHFSPQRSGAARMYVVHTRRAGGLARLSKVLDGSGVNYRTVVRGRQRTDIYVVDLGNELRRQVASAARRLRARVTVMSGAGEFVGDEGDPSKAQGIFDGIIGRYEKEHPELKRDCEKRRRKL